MIVPLGLPGHAHERPAFLGQQLAAVVRLASDEEYCRQATTLVVCHGAAAQRMARVLCARWGVAASVHQERLARVLGEVQRSMMDDVRAGRLPVPDQAAWQASVTLRAREVFFAGAGAAAAVAPYRDRLASRRAELHAARGTVAVSPLDAVVISPLDATATRTEGATVRVLAPAAAAAADDVAGTLVPIGSARRRRASRRVRTAGLVGALSAASLVGSLSLAAALPGFGGAEQTAVVRVVDDGAVSDLGPDAVAELLLPPAGGEETTAPAGDADLPAGSSTGGDTAPDAERTAGADERTSTDVPASTDARGGENQGRTDTPAATARTTNHGRTDKPSTASSSGNQGRTDKPSTTARTTNQGRTDKPSQASSSGSQGRTDKPSTTARTTNQGRTDKPSTTARTTNQGRTDRPAGPVSVQGKVANPAQGKALGQSKPQAQADTNPGNGNGNGNGNGPSSAKGGR